MNLHYQRHGDDSEDYTFDLPDDHDIYEVGFRIGALNNDGTVTYTHTDETTQVNVLEGQDNSNIQTMFEDVVYNIYDSLETFIDSFTITINDWSLLDDISFKYVTTTTTTTTTTTLPPPPKPPDPPPLPPEPEVFVVILDNGEEAEYEQHEIDDGTVERDNQRQKNFEIYGVELTDEQIERGDLEQYDIEIIDEQDMVENREEFTDDVDISDVDENRDKETDIAEENNEFDETVLEVEEYLEDLEEIEIQIIDIEEIKDIKIIIIEEEEFLDEEIITDDTTENRSMEMEDVLEDRQDELGRDTTGSIEFSEEELEKEIEELEEVVEIEEIFTEEIIEDEEAKEEAIEQYVEELETEEVIEVLEEVNDIGLDNIAEVSQDVIEVVAQVVEEVITIAQEEDLTEEQVEVVAEVLGFEETEDVEIIAEAVKTDQNVAQAVDEYVERAVENKDVENYTLADATTEIAFETFVADPISVIIDVDLENITLNNITSDMTQDQKEKAQEVIVPTLLVKIASLAFRRFN
jgi:hypothetical protein